MRTILIAAVIAILAGVIYQKVVEDNPFAAKIGIEILDIRQGYVCAKVKVKKEVICISK